MYVCMYYLLLCIIGPENCGPYKSLNYNLSFMVCNSCVSVFNLGLSQPVIRAVCQTSVRLECCTMFVFRESSKYITECLLEF